MDSLGIYWVLAGGMVFFFFFFFFGGGGGGIVVMSMLSRLLVPCLGGVDAVLILCLVSPASGEGLV